MSTPRSGLIVSAFLACAALVPASAAASQIIGSLADPTHGSIAAGLDILAARVEQQGGRFTFVIQTRGDVPTPPPNPDDGYTYLWLLDTDEDPATGQPHGALGSEFNVRVVIGQTHGGGYVDVTGAEPGGGNGTVVVQGSTVTITVWLSQVASPSDFNWRCSSFGVVGGSYVPGNPETAISQSDALPYTPPARVTLVTPILELCPSGPATGQLQVEILDAAGIVLPSENYVLSFQSSSPSVASVNDAGVVTAHAPAQYHWQRPYINAWADGVMADNAATVRVNSSDLGVVHQMYPAEHVTLALVPQLEGVNLDSITTHYQVVEATERAYMEQLLSVGQAPINGARQYLVLDVADDPNTTVCGASGNPICLGWLWGQPAHNSCYIVNDPANRVPQWFVIFHELGHNFTCACNAFNMFLWSPSPPHNTAYSEGLASLAALWCWQRIVASPGGLDPASAQNIDAHFAGNASYFRECLANYRTNGVQYDQLDANVLDGILLEMLDRYGLKAWYDLSSTFLPATDPIPIAMDTKEKQATWFVAALSASCGQDLRDLFRTEYGFPVDDAAWPEILAVVQARVAARTWTAGAPPAADVAVAGPLLRTSPNPFTSGAQVRFTLPSAGRAVVAVFDVSGRRVRTLVAGTLSAGPHMATWNGRDDRGRRLPAGIYLLELATPAGTSRSKLTLLD